MSDADKIALRNNTASIKCKLIVQASGNLPAIELTEDNSVKDWEYTDDRLVPNNGFIGQFVGRTLDGNLQNISDSFSILDREIKLMFCVRRKSNNTYVETWYDFGNFLVTEPEDNEVNDNTKFEAMDYTKKFNTTFNADFTNTTYTESYNTKINNGETVTASWLASYTCAQVGVTLATSTFPNSTFEIDNNPFQAGESCRDVMKAIGQLAFSWVRIGWDNQCYIDFNTHTSSSNVSQYDVLDNNQYYSLEIIGENNPINAVGFGMKNIDGETALLVQTGTTGDNAIYLYDNPFLYTYEKRYNAVQAGSVLFGLTYTQLKTETIGHPWFIGTECINIKDMESNNNYTFPFNKTIKYSGHIRSNISSIDKTEVEKTYGYTSSMEKAARKATIEVDKQNGVITSFTQDIGESLQALSVRQDSQELSINIISTNITMEGENAGDINSVTTKEKKFTLNDNGLSIENSITNYKSLQNETGTYYYDGNNITGQYTKDGSKQKDLSLFGVYYYGMDDKDDTPMFVAQLYTDNNGVEAFGHFWNGGDY